MQDMSLSQTAEFGFLKLAKAFEWIWQERKGSEVGGNLGQAGPHCAHFCFSFFLILGTIMYLGLWILVMYVKFSL